MNEKELHINILRRPYQRSLNLKVRLNGSLRVTCGLNVKDEIIQKFIRQSHDFIEKSLAEVNALKARFPRIEFVTGDLLMFGGELLPLQLVWGWMKRPQVQFFEDSIELKIPVGATREERQKAIAKAYTKLARNTLMDRVLVWSERMQLRPTEVSVRGQRTRWGSCSPQGKINLNWKLVGTPADVMDYVVIHELAHLAEANHSPRFWKIVETYCPDYRQSRKWLKVHQYELEFLEPKSELHSRA